MTNDDEQFEVQTLNFGITEKSDGDSENERRYTSSGKPERPASRRAALQQTGEYVARFCDSQGRPVTAVS